MAGRRNKPEKIIGRLREAEIVRAPGGVGSDAGQADPAGSLSGKLLSPARRRRCIDHVRATLPVSERRICRVLGQRRSTQRKGVQLPLMPFGQGFVDMAPAVDAFEAAMLVGKLKHGDSPILRWQASNAEFQTDPAGNRKLTKGQRRSRIDGIVAMVMAIGLAARSEVKKTVKPSVSWI